MANLVQRVRTPVLEPKDPLQWVRSCQLACWVEEAGTHEHDRITGLALGFGRVESEGDLGFDKLARAVASWTAHTGCEVL